MRAILQRVSSAKVKIDGETASKIGPGLLVLIGITIGDGQADIDYMVKKITTLRLFSDDDGFDRSVIDIGGELLVVSQFTLYAEVKKGRRPSFDKAAGADIAKRVYENLIEKLRAAGAKTATGVFRAKMAVELVNEGPVTIVLDSRES